MRIISRLEVQGFKSCKDPVLIEFCYPITLILGSNGVGKSTILESISYIFNPLKGKAIPFHVGPLGKSSSLTIVLTTTESDFTLPRSLKLHQGPTPRASLYEFNDAGHIKKYPIDIDEDTRKEILLRLLGLESIKRASNFALASSSTEFLRLDEKSYFSAFNDLFKNERTELIIKNLKSSIPSKNANSFESTRLDLENTLAEFFKNKSLFKQNEKIMKKNDEEVFSLRQNINTYENLLSSMKDIAEFKSFFQTQLENLSKEESAYFCELNAKSNLEEAQDLLAQLIKKEADNVTRRDNITLSSQKLQTQLDKANQERDRIHLAITKNKNEFRDNAAKIARIFAKMNYREDLPLSIDNFDPDLLMKIATDISQDLVEKKDSLFASIKEKEQLLAQIPQCNEILPQLFGVDNDLRQLTMQLESRYANVKELELSDDEFKKLETQKIYLEGVNAKSLALQSYAESFYQIIGLEENLANFVLNAKELYKSSKNVIEEGDRSLVRLKQSSNTSTILKNSLHKKLIGLDETIKNFNFIVEEDLGLLQETLQNHLDNYHLMEGKKIMAKDLVSSLEKTSCCPICSSQLDGPKLQSALNSLSSEEISSAMTSLNTQAEIIKKKINFLELLDEQRRTQKTYNETCQQLHEIEQEISSLDQKLANHIKIVRFIDRFGVVEYVEDYAENPKKLLEVKSILEQNEKFKLLQKIDEKTKLKSKIEDNKRALTITREIEAIKKEHLELENIATELAQFGVLFDETFYAINLYREASEEQEDNEIERQKYVKKLKENTQQLQEISTFTTTLPTKKNALATFIRVRQKHASLGDDSAENFDKYQTSLIESKKELEQKMGENKHLEIANSKLSGIISEQLKQLRNLETKVLSQMALKKAIEELSLVTTSLEKDISLAKHSSSIENFERVLNQNWSQLYKEPDLPRLGIDMLQKDTKKSENVLYHLVKINGNTITPIIPGQTTVSEGQKALISFAVRKTYIDLYTNCGVIALDEPTANLDSQKVINFTQSLVSMLSRGSTSMQLVIISHDESFLDALRSSGYPPEFYIKLSKSEADPAATTSTKIYSVL